MFFLQALDSYVIRGVTHNIPLLRDIITESKFVAGDVTTNYLPEVYPEGFKAHALDAAKRQRLDAVAAAVFVKDVLRQSLFSNQSRVPVKASSKSKWNLNVSLDDGASSSKVVVEARPDGGFDVTNVADGSSTSLGDVINFSDPLIQLSAQDTMQLISNNHCGDIALQFMGTIFKVRVLEDRFADKVQYMPEKPVVDLGKFVLAPMPGIIKSLAVMVSM